jgi:serine protease
VRTELRLVPLGGLLLVAACQDAPTATSVVSPAPTPLAAVAQGQVSDFIVVLRSTETDVAGTAARLTTMSNGAVKTVWQHALKGFVAQLSATSAAQLAARPEVASIEADGIATTFAVQTPVGSWGQDRVDQRNLPLNNSFTYPNTANNVNVYTIDTGLLGTHNEFTGRVGNGINFVNAPAGGNQSWADCNGHGTHVTGTIAGTVYGLAKGATVHAVRVLDCGGSGSWSWVISGMNWVAANAVKPAVANMSLGGGLNSAVNQAAINLANSGVLVALASGNSSANACSFSPAAAGTTNGVITTNASTNTDARASFSNFGTCTDIFAPGQSIKSAWIGGNTQTNTISGTSMASPHVAGVGALYLSANPASTPSAAETAIKTNATPNKITNAGSGSPNLLVYTGFIGGAPPPPTNQPPVANFSFTCNAAGHYCDLNAGTSTDDGGIGNLTFAWSAPGRPGKTGQVIRRFNTTCDPGHTCGPEVYNETLTVKDAQGLTHAVTKSVTIP